MDNLRALPPDFFSEMVANGKVETALLVKRNGRLLAAWSHSPVSWEVVSIMAATALGSVETMLETLRVECPQSVTVLAGGSRIYIHKVEPQGFLVLIAREVVTEAFLRDTARKLLARFPTSEEAEARRKVTLGPSLHASGPAREGSSPASEPSADETPRSGSR